MQNKEPRPPWSPPDKIYLKHQEPVPREFVGLVYGCFKMKGISLVGEVWDGRSIRMNQRDQVKQLLPGGYEIAFTWRYWMAGGFSSIIIERAVRFYTQNDVDNIVDLCSQMWTIIQVKKISTRFADFSTGNPQGPYVKINPNDSTAGVLIDLSTIPQD